MKRAAGGLQDQVACRISSNLPGTQDLELDPTGISSGRDCEVVFQLLMISVVNKIDSWIHIFVADSGICLNISLPLRGVSADEVIDPARLSLFSDDYRMLGCSE